MIVVKAEDEEEKEEKNFVNIDINGHKCVKKLGREILPYCQIIFVLIYAVIANIKWNSY